MANITIANGTGSANIANGNYNVSATVNGYDNSSILPSTVSVTEGTNTYAFTIGATGTLTLHVTEDGTSAGTAVIGATFTRTDAEGNEYGSVITTDSNGDAVFNNVPFSAENAPTIYYKQLTTSESHEFDGTVKSTTLTTSTITLEVANPLAASRTINLTDANYENLPIESGTINLGE